MTTPANPRFGRYEIRGLLGRGGFAEVFRAWDSALGREVAVKTLLPHLASDPEMRKRFTQEAQAVARLRHPHIVTIHDVGEADGRPFFAMELVEGQTIAAMLASSGPPSPVAAIAILRGLASAIDYLHAAGLIHRDIKAANVMVDRAGRAVLMDFGIARAMDQTALTSAGAIIGSPEAMAPEQVLGRPITPATDIYALGILAFQLFAGRPPFQGDTGYVLHAHGYEPPPPLRRIRPDAPAAAEQAVTTALEKNPQRRPASAMAFVAVLAGEAAPSTLVLDPGQVTEPTKVFVGEEHKPRRFRAARLVLLALAVAVVLAAIGGGALLVSREPRSRSSAEIVQVLPSQPAASPNAPSTSATPDGPQASVASNVAIYDQVLDARTQQREEFRIVSDSVVACFDLTIGATSQPLVVVATDSEKTPFAANDPNVLARSGEVARKAGPACVPLKIQTASLAAPARYWVWVLEGSTVVGRGGFRTRAAPTPTPALPVVAQATATPTRTVTATATTAPAGPLQAGQLARIAQDQSCLLLRSTPSTNPQTPTQDCLDPGGHVLLLEGPRTEDGETWWRVRPWSGGLGSPEGWARGRFLSSSPACNQRRDAAACDTSYTVTPPLTGDWDLTDYIWYGQGREQQHTFRVSLREQNGQVSGSGTGLTISGTLTRRTVRATYRQGSATGTFVWTLTRDGSRMEGAFTNSIGNGGASYGRRIGGAVTSADQATIAVVGPNGISNPSEAVNAGANRVRLGSTFYVCFTVSRISDVTIISSHLNGPIEHYNNTYDDGTGECTGPFSPEGASPRTFTIEMRVGGVLVHRAATTVTFGP